MAKVVNLVVDRNEICPGEQAIVVATTDHGGPVEWRLDSQEVGVADILVVGSAHAPIAPGQTRVIEARTDENSLSVTVTCKIADVKMELDPQPVNQIYMITPEPRMPSITARVVGVGGPASGSQWHVSISNVNVILELCGPHPPHDLVAHFDFSPTTSGEQITLDFNNLIRGGDLSIGATSTVNGCAVDAGAGAVIHGTNPQRSDIQAALPHDTLRRIACKESGQRQFDAPPDGGTDRCPLFGPGGRAGIMQIANPTHDVVWNWRLNVAKGMEIFNEKVAASRNYPNRVRASPGFQNLIDQFNQRRQRQGLDPAQVILPDFTMGNFDDDLQQLELDAIRGYNGWEGSERFGFELHEFRVAVDVLGGAEVLRVTNINEGTLQGEAFWERVPVADRPAGVGNPNYVEEVLAFLPGCSLAATPCEIRIDIVDGAQTTNVGQRIRLRAVVVTPPNGSITSLTWDIQGAAIRTYAQALATATVTNLTQADLTSNPVEFFWIDGGSKTVRVDAVVNGTFRCSASVTFTLMRPEVLTFTSVRGAIAINTAWGPLSLGFGSPATPGITWTAMVKTTGVLGSVAFLQLANTDIRVTVTAAPGEENWQVTTGGAFLLDRAGAGMVFYGDRITPISVFVPALVTVHAVNDSPKLELNPVLQDGSMDHTFQLYLMYRPTGAGNIWVSLARLDWGGCARATLASGGWALNGPRWLWDHPFVNTTQLPVWAGRANFIAPVGPLAPAPVNCAAAPPPPPPTPTLRRHRRPRLPHQDHRTKDKEV
jgi:hypothetical protein